MSSRHEPGRAQNMFLLIVEEDVGPHGLKDRRFAVRTNEMCLIRRSAPSPKRMDDAGVGRCISRSNDTDADFAHTLVVEMDRSQFAQLLQKVSERPRIHRLHCIFDLVPQEANETLGLVDKVRFSAEQHSIAIECYPDFAIFCRIAQIRGRAAKLSGRCSCYRRRLNIGDIIRKKQIDVPGRNIWGK